MAYIQQLNKKEVLSRKFETLMLLKDYYQSRFVKISYIVLFHNYPGETGLILYLLKDIAKILMDIFFIMSLSYRLLRKFIKDFLRY